MIGFGIPTNFLIHFDEKLWKENLVAFPAETITEVTNLAATPDGGFVVTDSVTVGDTNIPRIIRYDPMNGEVWFQDFPHNRTITQVTVGEDGAIYVAGNTPSEENSADHFVPWVAKIIEGTGE